MKEAIAFGTDGWRAIIAQHFTFANVERAVYAIGLYMRGTYGKSTKPVLIGYDPRFLADKFALLAAKILTGMGNTVKVVSRDVPTPCIAWATKHEPTQGALQFTASHNPPEYLGLKYIPHFAGPATNDITDAIVRHLCDLPDDYQVHDCSVEFFDPAPPYLAALGDLVDLKKIGSSGLKIGYDALFSTSRGYLDEILKRNGLQPAILHDWRDPLFGGMMPEPKPQYLIELINLVKSKKLDIGLATDGDADRFAVIDEKGDYFSPNQLLCLLTRHLVKNRGMKGAVVRTVATTHLLDRLARHYGLELIETPVGFKYIGEIMRTGDVLIGGEESGGVSVKGHIPEKDGILANLLLTEMLAFEKKPLSSIWNDLVVEAGVSLSYKRSDMELPGLIQKSLMERLYEQPMKSLAGVPIAKIGRKDGLKLYIDDENWLLIRPSGTEPLLRLYAEGTSSTKIAAIMSDFRSQVEGMVEELSKSTPAKVKTEALKIAGH